MLKQCPSNIRNVFDREHENNRLLRRPCLNQVLVFMSETTNPSADIPECMTSPRRKHQRYINIVARPLEY